VIDGLMPYPTYKDACAPWLGDVPEQWGVLRQRNTVTMLVSNIDKLTAEGELPVRLCNYVDVYKNDRITASLSFMHATATTDEVERFRLQFGDVLITKDSESWTDIGVPALVEYTAPDLVCGYHLAILRPREGVLDGGYLLRALQSQGVAVQFRMSANGVTRYGLSHDAIKSVLLPIPPLPEQVGIVRFLDHADLRIRRSIVAKKKLIALLNEQKQAIIHRAVTRGLDPNVRLKPSGVEWLGDVPEHWEVRRIKSLSLVKRGASPRPIADPAYFDEEGEYAWVRIADVTASSRYLERTSQRLSPLGHSLSVRLEPGSLFLSIAGSVGKPMITQIKCCIHDGFVYFPQFRGNAEFLYRVFATGAPFARLGKLGTQLNLNTDTVGNIRVGWPPSGEQAAIVSFLNEATEYLEGTIQAAQREIVLLREFRTRLIADVVTGKIDVRAAAARLPHEGDEPEPLDDLEVGADGDESGDEADLDAVPEQAEA
jgi:type I restriction enzyme S subunit